MKAANTPEVTKTYRREMPNTWWLKRPSYFFFMVRELSSVFVLIYVLLLLGQVASVACGADGFAASMEKFQSPWMILLNLVIAVFVLYHMVTWFRISGRIFGSGPLSPGAVTAVNYVVWVAASVAVIVFLVRG
jgi:fumarate reductase subunit C